VELMDFEYKGHLGSGVKIDFCLQCVILLYKLYLMMMMMMM
jgi:hypothetical protein